MRWVEMGPGYILHVIHVVGTRMKLVVVDCFSQGDLLEGIMNGQNPLDIILLNESAYERSGGG